MASDTAPENDTEPAEARGGRMRLVLILLIVLLLAGGAGAIALMNIPPSAAPGASEPPASDPPTSEAPSGPPTATPEVPPDDPSLPRDPVEIDEPSPIVPGLTAAIAKLEAVDGVASRPGEVAGPAVRVTVTITNTTAQELSLAAAVVTAYYGGEETPAGELGSPGAVAMPASVGAGGTATAVYVFTIPSEQRSLVRIVVDYSVDVQPLVFEGSAPTS